jgi:Transglycosylase SLT domain
VKPDLAYLAYYAYSEVPPDTKPADTALDALKDIPAGTPIEEIKLASDTFGLDSTFMKAVAKIESSFDPKQRTGSYIGLFQLSNYEFDKYGSGDITDPRDNAIAAAYKFITAAILFEISTHKKPTLSDLYLIHQQGTQGAAEHVAHPERIAWKSMCATDEGRVKGEKWCKRAVWQNTLPAIKQIWKSVDNLTSGAFVDMWQQRVDLFYSRYSEAAEH